MLQLLCLPEIRVPEAKRKPAYELLALVNEQLWLGHFDIWSSGGVLLYRHGLMLGSRRAAQSVDGAARGRKRGG